MKDSLLPLDSSIMSRSAWESPSHIGTDLDGLSYNSTARQSGVALSRSQDDATVSYHFQRPQSENDLQAYGGGKRWAIGDETLVEQVQYFPLYFQRLLFLLLTVFTHSGFTADIEKIVTIQCEY